MLCCSKFPDLFTWLKEFLGYKDSTPMETMTSFKERTSGELAHLEIGNLKETLIIIGKHIIYDPGTVCILNKQFQLLDKTRIKRC